MARKSSLPEEVTRYKPCKCARIRNDGGVYRVYKYSAVKLASGEWSSDYGYLIGKIIPGEGFFQTSVIKKNLLNRTLNRFRMASRMLLMVSMPFFSELPGMCWTN